MGVDQILAGRRPSSDLTRAAFAAWSTAAAACSALALVAVDVRRRRRRAGRHRVIDVAWGSGFAVAAVAAFLASAGHGDPAAGGCC